MWLVSSVVLAFYGLWLTPVAAAGETEGFARWAAAAPEAQRPQRQMDLVVDHQEVFGRQAAPLLQAAGGMPAAVHVGHGLEQPGVAAGPTDPRDLAEELVLAAHDHPMGAGQFIDEPETRIVPGFGIFWSWIAQSDHKTDTVIRHLTFAGGLGRLVPFFQRLPENLEDMPFELRELIQK